MPINNEELEELVNTKDWNYDCTAYGEGQLCCCDKGHPNLKRLDTLIQSTVNKAVQEIIGEDDTEEPLNHNAVIALEARAGLRTEQREKLQALQNPHQKDKTDE